MIEISTTTTNSLQNNLIEKGSVCEDLGEEEQSFYISLKPGLNAIVYNPPQETINSILNYSKSV